MKVSERALNCFVSVGAWRCSSRLLKSWQLRGKSFVGAEKCSHIRQPELREALNYWMWKVFLKASREGKGFIMKQLKCKKIVVNVKEKSVPLIWINLYGVRFVASVNITDLTHSFWLLSRRFSLFTFKEDKEEATGLSLGWCLSLILRLVSLLFAEDVVWFAVSVLYLTIYLLTSCGHKICLGNKFPHQSVSSIGWLGSALQRRSSDNRKRSK